MSGNPVHAPNNSQQPAAPGGAAGSGGVRYNAAGHPIAADDTGSLATMNADGSRRWLSPKPSFGAFWKKRAWVAWVLIAVFVTLPWLTINGRPALLLDLTTRRFDIFGHRFLPTDTVLLALLGLSIGVTLFLVTALFGRVWCGWACPHTVYLEFVYRPLERLFTGTPGRARKTWLQRSGMGAVLKWPVYGVISFLLANIFLSYFVGVENLKLWVFQSPAEHIGPFVLVMVVTAMMLFNFGVFREQTCLVVCPYGRFQSVMLDKQTTIVAYDQQRGEPRGKGKRAVTHGARQSPDRSLPVLERAGGAAPPGVKAGAGKDAAACACDGCDGPGACGTKGHCGGSGACSTAGSACAPKAKEIGDCVDCGQCVATCPTGIDIRNGLQMECINCTQCIDACNAVMVKLGREPGLIGFRSQDEADGRPRKRARARVFVYPALLTMFITAFIGVLVFQAPSYIRVLRGQGRPYTMMDDGRVGNPIKLHIINRHSRAVTYQIETIDGRSNVRVDAQVASEAVESGGTLVLPAFLVAEPGAFAHGKYEARLKISDSTGFSREIEFRMIGPTGAATRPGSTSNEPVAAHKESRQ
jgi:polyferredoxin